MSFVSRSGAGRRLCAAGLAVLVVLATASPVLAAGAAAPREAGAVERLVSWIATLWASAAGLLETPGGGETRDGGCIIDPSGSCHSGAVTPPGGEDD